VDEDSGLAPESRRDGVYALGSPHLVGVLERHDGIGVLVESSIDGVSGVEADRVSVRHDLFRVLR